MLELKIVEGEDRGAVFPVGSGETQIGRRTAGDPRRGAILVSDVTVSAQQARLRMDGDGCVLEHDPAAANPTLVNDREIQSCRLQPGDRIRMGTVLFEVGEASVSETAAPGAEQTVMLQVPTAPARGNLVVVEADKSEVGRRFPLLPTETTLGRAEESNVRLSESGISRRHATIAWHQDVPVLRHESRTNPTYINGVRVEESAPLKHGDVIHLANQVALRLEISNADAAQQPDLGASAGAPKSDSLVERMEELRRMEDEIEREFVREGAFLDVDVVDSTGMKRGQTQARDIALSFERFRTFVKSSVEQANGRIFNSNGDEVMCFFDRPEDAARGGTLLLEGLATFNAERNLLDRPFKVRVGVHSGTCPMDLARGVAYSQVLDFAGHLQKEAPTNGLLISGDTYEALPDGSAFTACGVIERDGIEMYGWVGNEDAS